MACRFEKPREYASCLALPAPGTMLRNREIEERQAHTGKVSSKDLPGGILPHATMLRLPPSLPEGAFLLSRMAGGPRLLGGMTKSANKGHQQAELPEC